MRNALEQALHDRRPVQQDGPVHHSDRSVLYVFYVFYVFRYTRRLAETLDGLAQSTWLPAKPERFTLIQRRSSNLGRKR